MHDGQLEERVRAVLRAEGDALPLTITPEELERRLASRHRERMGNRLGLVAAGVAVVLVGSLVAVSNGWLGAPRTGSGPSAPPSDESIPSEADVACARIDPSTADQMPTVGVGLTPGDSIVHTGWQTETRIGDHRVFLDHFGPGPDPIHLEPGVRLEVVARDPSACFTQVTGTYVRGGVTHSFAAVSAESEFTLGNNVALSLPPGHGEWRLTIDASFLAIDPAIGASSKTIFRIVVPEPGPHDDSELGPFPILASPPHTILLDSLHEPSTPSEQAGTIETSVSGHVPPRAGYIIDIACKGPSPMRWSIGREGHLDFLAAGNQPCDGTLVNGLIDRGTPNASLEVLVKADSATAWRIRLASNEDEPAFIPPVLRAIETGNGGGSNVAVEAYGRCGAPGDSSVPCGGEWFDLDGARVLRLPSGARVTFGLEDAWRIDAARITAVRVADLGENTFAPEHSVAFVDQPGPLASVDVPLGPGSWIVRVALNGSRDAATFNAHYDMRFEIE